MTSKIRLVLCILLALGTGGLSQAWAAGKKQAPPVSIYRSIWTQSIHGKPPELGRPYPAASLTARRTC